MVTARLKIGESLGDRIMKVNHAGEHGAICIYKAQRWVVQLRAPQMVAELDRFLAHETQHRTIFERELLKRGRRRCRSYHFCGLGGLLLGLLTGIAGRNAISATTVAIERVVLSHLDLQRQALEGNDQAAVDAIDLIVADERDHLDSANLQLGQRSFWLGMLDAVVAASTEAVIWLGMRL